MLHAQMPEPVPDVERQPVEEPPNSTPPVEDPPPGELAPTSPIPDRLSATGPEHRPDGLERLVRWSGGHGGQADERVIADGHYDFQACAAPQVATITFHRWPVMRSWLAGPGLATALLLGSVAVAHSQPPPVPAIPPDTQPTPPAEIMPSHPANGRPAPGVPGTDVQRGPQSEIPAPLPPGARPDTPGVFPMPVIPPPGTPDGNPIVAPK